MNFFEEKQKPLYLIRASQSRGVNARQRFTSLANEHLIEEAQDGMYMVKAAALDSMPELLSEAVQASDSNAKRKLIIARLRAVPNKHYRFLDGTDLTGDEAAREIESDTARGKYFMRLEEKVLSLAREAKERGDF